MAADEVPESIPETAPAEEYLDEEAYIVVPEKIVLEMLRAVSAGADPDFTYAEFYANSAVQQVVACDECECCECEETDDDCECECLCETEDEEEE